MRIFKINSNQIKLRHESQIIINESYISLYSNAKTFYDQRHQLAQGHGVDHQKYCLISV